MNVKILQTITKPADQAWNINFDMDKSVSEGPQDPRDKTSSFTEEEKQVFLNFTRFCHSQPGYLGWDRSYVGDNQVVITHYFNNVDDATNYFQTTREPNNPQFQAVKQMMSDKYGDLQNNVTWKLVNQDNVELAKLYIYVKKS